MAWAGRPKRPQQHASGCRAVACRLVQAQDAIDDDFAMLRVTRVLASLSVAGHLPCEVGFCTAHMFRVNRTCAASYAVVILLYVFLGGVMFRVLLFHCVPSHGVFLFFREYEKARRTQVRTYSRVVLLRHFRAPMANKSRHPTKARTHLHRSCAVYLQSMDDFEFAHG